jgi:ABC-2 type transport system permease protein
MLAFFNYLLRLANLCQKEFIAVLKDPANRVILIVPPILQSLLFGYAANFDLTNVPYAVLDESRGGASTELIARFDGTGVFHRVATLDSASQISEVIDTGSALLVVHFSPDFERLLSAGHTTPLQVILDGRNSTTAGSAVGQLQAIISAYNQRDGHEAAKPAVTVMSRAWYNPNLESRWNIVPALIASLSMIQTIMLAALSVAREREQGTFDQLLVTPYTPLQIMIGKAIPSIAIGLSQAMLVLTISLYWFDIPMTGNFWALLLAMLMFMITIVGIGLSISALSANMQQAMLYTFVLIMPLTLLSGLATPVSNMPHFMQMATYANPLRFAIDLVRRIYLEGAPLTLLWHDFIPFVGITLVTMPLAAWLFRNKL